MEPGQGVPRSKRSERQEKKAKSHGPLAWDGTPMGQVHYDNDGNMFYRKNDSDMWHAAVYHKDIRARLIEECEQLGFYNHPRGQGYDELDITSFHPDQKTWGGSREHRPEILFQVYIDKSPHPKPGLWQDDGRVVLDIDNHPLKNYWEIPRTCSSEIEGWNIEAIQRLNPDISHMDFWARMPHIIGAQGKRLFKPTTFSNRSWRFRKEAGCLSTKQRAGTADLNALILSLLPAECITANSTRGFRDFNRAEITLLDNVNKEKFPERAGIHVQGVAALRKSRHASEDVEISMQAHASGSGAYGPQGSRNRPNKVETEVEDDDAELATPIKRQNRNVPLLSSETLALSNKLSSSSSRPSLSYRSLSFPPESLPNEQVSGKGKRKAKTSEPLENNQGALKRQRRMEPLRGNNSSIRQAEPLIYGYRQAGSPEHAIFSPQPQFHGVPHTDDSRTQYSSNAVPGVHPFDGSFQALNGTPLPFNSHIQSFRGDFSPRDGNAQHIKSRSNFVANEGYPSTVDPTAAYPATTSAAPANYIYNHPASETLLPPVPSQPEERYAEMAAGAPDLYELLNELPPGFFINADGYPDLTFENLTFEEQNEQNIADFAPVDNGYRAGSQQQTDGHNQLGNMNQPASELNPHQDEYDSEVDGEFEIESDFEVHDNRQAQSDSGRLWSLPSGNAVENLFDNQGPLYKNILGQDLYADIPFDEDFFLTRPEDLDLSLFDDLDAAGT